MFSIGDRVCIIKAPYGGPPTLIGKVGTVVNEPAIYVLVRIDGRKYKDLLYGFLESELKKIEE